MGAVAGGLPRNVPAVILLAIFVLAIFVGVMQKCDDDGGGWL